MILIENEAVHLLKNLMGWTKWTKPCRFFGRLTLGEPCEARGPAESAAPASATASSLQAQRCFGMYTSFHTLKPWKNCLLKCNKCEHTFGRFWVNKEEIQTRKWYGCNRPSRARRALFHSLLQCEFEVRIFHLLCFIFRPSAERNCCGVSHNTLNVAYPNLRAFMSTVKAKHLFQGVLTCFGCENKMGVICILVIFQSRPSHINQKVLLRAFHWCDCTEVYLKKRRTSPRFIFTTKAGKYSPERVFQFYSVVHNFVKSWTEVDHWGEKWQHLKLRE